MNTSTHRKEKVSTIYQEASGKRPVFSFEFFPPKNTVGIEHLYNTIKDLREFKPDFVSVTCGAGGSTRSNTKEWSQDIQENCNITTMSHYTSIGIQRSEVDLYLRELKAAGIKNIMALRGDLPRDRDNYTPPEDGFCYASELITYIRKTNFDFSIGGACYPEVHIEASSAKEDLENLKKKVTAGADFLITQLFFTNEAYLGFVERCRSAGIDLPIVPGIMPITNYKQVERFTKMTGCRIPKSLLNKITRCGENKTELYQISYEHSLRQCQELLEQKVPGIHFYTLNQSNMSKDILKELVT